MYPKTSLFALSGLLFVSSIAHGDTYNFFFEQAKNKGKKQQQSSDSPSTQSVGQPSVEIRNNVTAPGPTSPPPVDEKLEVPPPQVSSSLDATLVAPSSTRPSRWKVGFGPMLSRVPYTADYQTQFGTQSRWDRPALVLSLGYRFMPAFGVNTFLGLHQNYDWNPVFGADLETYPIRVSVGSFDLLEIGLVAGVSNILMAAASTGGISPHLGGRLNINLGSHVTLTTALRMGERFHSAEWSLAFNL